MGQLWQDLHCSHGRVQGNVHDVPVPRVLTAALQILGQILIRSHYYQ